MAKGRGISRTALALGAAGLTIGVVAALLVSQGNPGNMGLCIACFLRDTVGFFGGAGANMGSVAYIRPEIVGLVIGALVAALAGREFRARGGSAVLLRFALGFIFMCGALIFLGCTVRAWLRVAGGDWNALFGVAGLVAGVAVGTVFLRKGFDLGRARKLPVAAGWFGPGLAVVLLGFAVAAAFFGVPGGMTVTPAGAKSTAEKAVIAKDGTVLKPAGATIKDGAVVAADGSVVSPAASVTAAKAMPGGLRDPFVLALVAGLGLGVVAQRSRFCTVGGIRDAIIWKRFDVLLGIGGLVVGALVANLALGQFNPGFAGQPVAHTDMLGNFAAMGVAGLAAVLLGGCPFRQVIMSGEGDADAFVAVLGMMAGAYFMHSFQLASSAKGLAPMAWPLIGVMAAALIGIGVWMSAGARRRASESASEAPQEA
jgi:YedE family putative selenium metabolism protein